MAVLQEVAITVPGSGAAGPVTDAVREVIRGELARHFWRWYEQHREDVLLRRTVVIFKVTIRVRDLRDLFVMLFGAEPANVASR